MAARHLAFDVVRVASLAAAAWAVVSVAFKTVGRTALGWTVSVLAVGVAGLEAAHLLTPLETALDAQAVELGGVRISLWFVIRAILVVGGLLWLAQRVGDLLERGIAGERVLSRSGHVLFAKLARAALTAAAILFSLAFLGVDVTALAVLSGAVGLGLGFGLQKIVSNYISGLILLMDKSIKPGDVIEVELSTGRVRGEVTELAGRYTAITLRTGTETLIPNEVLISSPVINWSHTSREVQIRVPVGVAYSTDVEAAIALCVEAARAAPRVLATPEPVCFIVGFGDSSVDLEIRFWIRDAERGVRNVSSAVYLEVWKRFRENGVEIPFPQRDLHIRSATPITVRAEAAESGEGR
ncbi:MAG: mechanosensitive ion channel [Hyphomonadaceae bacterium]